MGVRAKRTNRQLQITVRISAIVSDMSGREFRYPMENTQAEGGDICISTFSGQQKRRTCHAQNLMIWLIYWLISLFIVIIYLFIVIIYYHLKLTVLT